MTLIEQIDEMSARRVNAVWAEKVTRSVRVDKLAALAFVENWPRDSVDARVILRAVEILDRGDYLTAEPAVTP